VPRRRIRSCRQRPADNAIPAHCRSVGVIDGLINTPPAFVHAAELISLRSGASRSDSDSAYAQAADVSLHADFLDDRRE
jgi:hypothetical protein